MYFLTENLEVIGPVLNTPTGGYRFGEQFWDDKFEPIGEAAKVRLPIKNDHHAAAMMIHLMFVEKREFGAPVVTHALISALGTLIASAYREDKIEEVAIAACAQLFATATQRRPLEDEDSK